MRYLHRVLGVSLALPVLLLIVTGVPLLATDTLGLGHKGVSFTWVHGAYSLRAPQQMRQAQSIAQLEDVLLTPERAVPFAGTLVGRSRFRGVVRCRFDLSPALDTQGSRHSGGSRRPAGTDHTHGNQRRR